jgi:hypothetical protein
MRVMTYAAVLRAIQPIIVPVFDALEVGLQSATLEHGRNALKREDDPWFYLHCVRRYAFERLRQTDLVVTVDDGDRSLLPLSGLLIPYRNVVLRVLRPEINSAGLEVTPIPGPSDAKQAITSC